MLQKYKRHFFWIRQPSSESNLYFFSYFIRFYFLPRFLRCRFDNPLENNFTSFSIYLSHICFPCCLKFSVHCNVTCVPISKLFVDEADAPTCYDIFMLINFGTSTLKGKVSGSHLLFLLIKISVCWHRTLNFEGLMSL